MSLIIEDGTIVTGANSFTTDAEFVTYATARGITLPSTEAERDVLQIKAMDKFFSIERELEGCRVSELQELPYPRVGVCANGFIVPSDSIPNGIKNGLIELAIQAKDLPLLINKTSQNIKRQKLDVLETEFFNGGSWENVRTDRADAYLDPYKINAANDNFLIRAMR